MTHAEILEQIKKLSLKERLEVIDAAIHLLRDELTRRELVDFFETHDMGDDWDQMREAHFDVDIKRRKHLVALQEDIVDKLTEIAKSKKVSSESLINAWLKDKIRRVTKIQKVA